MSSKGSMCLVRSHVEQTLRLAKTTSDIMAGLVDSTVVKFRQFLRVIDQQQCRRDTHDGP